MSDDSTDDHRDPERLFSALWAAHAHRILAYAHRHVGPDLADEVVAETFLVAWRRLADVPGEALPWLLVVARNTVANQRRSGFRRRAVSQELARVVHLVETHPSAETSALERQAVLRALATLSPREREALLLVSWDGLSPDAAAVVAGCSQSAFAMRLSRARTRLRHAAAADDPPAHVTARPHLELQDGRA